MNAAATSTPYGREFYLDQQDGSLRSAAAVVPHILESFHPGSVVDVGCGVGTWLSVVRQAGVQDVLGLDGDYVDRSLLKIPPADFLSADLRQPLPVVRGFDLAMCLEVAEHLPEAAGAALVRQLTALAPVVVFSAAIPGQAGTDHINEQWQDYWRARFAAEGFAAYDVIRPRIWNDDRVDFWYRQNLVCYVRAGHPVAAGLTPVAEGASLNFVHPALFQRALEQADMFLSRAVSMLPRLAAKAMKRRLPGARAPDRETG
ncbi:bifunctional 2-polyprenyl-6-hydroxyphenol methylase/3-demethylubiquinol 3-O-methyltransferase UbiG [Roseococcus sp. SYP-B2431]|uniref:class I SAM-dependent methyltransferase n=1 Tax=Roseococcus sp. SYP-B2431 TaxID=2496640 RepID=UPI0013F4757D|nr:methyltransferase domain-containing protein [Roseococcus sp. SYP-B2431]